MLLDISFLHEEEPQSWKILKLYSTCGGKNVLLNAKQRSLVAHGVAGWQMMVWFFCNEVSQSRESLYKLSKRTHRVSAGARAATRSAAPVRLGLSALRRDSTLEPTALVHDHYR